MTPYPLALSEVGAEPHGADLAPGPGDLDGRCADGIGAGARARRGNFALVALAARGRARQRPQIVVAGDEHQARCTRARFHRFFLARLLHG